MIGRPDEIMRTSASAPTYASATPTRLPAAESNSDSVSTCRTSRSRPAPSETRTAISRCRAAPRASSMLATFVHMRTSRTPTIAITTRSGAAKPRRSVENPAVAGTTSIVTRRHCALPLAAAVSSILVRSSTRISARACSMDAPALRRPISFQLPPQ